MSEVTSNLRVQNVDCMCNINFARIRLNIIISIKNIFTEEFEDMYLEYANFNLQV